MKLNVIAKLPILLIALLFSAACGSETNPGASNFFEPREFGEYVFDGKPRLEAPERIDFGLVDLGTEVRRVATLRNIGRGDLEIYNFYVREPFGIRANDIESPLIIAPGESFDVELTLTMDQGEMARGELFIVTNDPEAPEYEIMLSAEVRRVPEVCSIPVIEARHELRGESWAEPTGAEPSSAGIGGRLDGAPLDIIELSARNSFDPEGRELTAVEWTIVDQPSDGAARFNPGPTSWTNELFLELAGRYIVELHVWNDRGERSCEPARMELIALPDAELHIQLVWDTPRDPNPHDDHGSDLDLHFLHPLGRFNDMPYDCFWQNPRPAWRARLDMDNANGRGPENVNLHEPEDGLAYGIGVHYFSDRGLGESFATVRIYLGGTLAREFRRQRLVQGQFWHVADVHWPSRRIEAIDNVFRLNP